ncbi:MAG: transcriptional repressor [Syntrophomonadaceae bacterium]|jgi:Fur family peroxide stress response transcriptional regulator|nr:transcriptional repressor [Syntrophomonadaceae bacterium]
MNTTIEAVTQKLVNNKIKPSYPRIKVMEYLMKWESHPTVDEIYSELLKEIPTLSKTTVYNTLGIFLERNLVQLINIEEHEARFDADISVHGHFKCERCARIEDFYFDESIIGALSLQNCFIREKHVYLKGICSACLDHNNAEGGIKYDSERN